MNVNADAALGAPGSAVTFAGSASLQAGGAIASSASRSYTIDDGATATLDTNGNTISIAGPIGGAGRCSRRGPARLTWAAGYFTGNTRIGAGVLETANSAALQFSTLDMNAADAGTLNMGGNANVVLGGLQGAGTWPSPPARRLTWATTTAAPPIPAG